MKLLSVLEKPNKAFFLFSGSILIALIGLVDFMAGYELSLSVLYVLPISLITWKTDQKYGVLACFASALVWLFADAATGHDYSHEFIPIWNTAIRLSFFLTITILLAKLRLSTDKERQLARTDGLTGAINARFFHDLLQFELDRFERTKDPFTLAYVDLDNFKTVNDTFGHPVGDRVLSEVVGSCKTCLRKTDIVARLGGDEFSVLLPETDETSARVVCSKLQQDLLAAMHSGGWPVTFSMGVLTCKALPASIDKLVHTADELMYDVKRSGKNAIKFSVYRG